MSANCGARLCLKARMNEVMVRKRRFLTNRLLAWLVAAAVVLALLVLFIADNFVLIEVRLLATRVQVRLAWALLGAFLLGGLNALVFARLLRTRRN